MRVLALTLLLLALAAAATAAQQQNPVERAEAALDAGDYKTARTLVARWLEADEAARTSDGALRPRALLLRAQLERDPTAAVTDYLAIVFGYPSSPQAGEALLRLGQALHHAGEHTRAAGYLERLLADYPGAAQRNAAYLWLARAQRAGAGAAAACATATAGARGAVRDPDLAMLLRAEEAAACQTLAAPAAETRTPPAAATPPARATTAATGRFTVQAGAFRSAASAQPLAARLQRAGFEARLVTVPANDLVRVRVGRFANQADAAALARRLRDRGFEAMVVSDAVSERRR
jgi:tetratricopeptide (TPR) repeat protein